MSKTANIKFASSLNYYAWHISWYIASTDVEQSREHVVRTRWHALSAR
jgi:hypothetical protein